MKVGDTVICIDDDFTQHLDLFIQTFEELPRKGQEYTIRRMETWDGKTRLLLKELKNPPFKDGPLKGCEPGFDSKRFKKPDVIEEIIEEENFETIENGR